MSIESWNVRKVKSANNMFKNAKAFNNNISLWDFDQCKSMNSFLEGANNFNYNLSSLLVPNILVIPTNFLLGTQLSNPATHPKWGVSQGITREDLNKAISDWKNNPTDPIRISVIENFNTSNIVDFSYMNFGPNFNLNITNWVTNSAITMEGMFEGAKSFNQDISIWNTANVTNMSKMFKDAHSFNYDVSNWVTTSVSTMSGMFNNAKSFNQPVISLNTVNVTDFSKMFSGAISFNQSVNFSKSAAVDLSFMLEGAVSFNQPINFLLPQTISENGIVGLLKNAKMFNSSVNINMQPSIKSTKQMFYKCESFSNISINSLNVSNITEFDEMFYGALEMSVDLSTWSVLDTATYSGFALSTKMNASLIPFPDIGLAITPLSPPLLTVLNSVSQNGTLVTHNNPNMAIKFNVPRTGLSYKMFIDGAEVVDNYFVQNGLQVTWSSPNEVSSGSYKYKVVVLDDNTSESVESELTIELSIAVATQDNVTLELNPVTADNIIDDLESTSTDLLLSVTLSADEFLYRNGITGSFSVNGTVYPATITDQTLSATVNMSDLIADTKYIVYIDVVNMEGVSSNITSNKTYTVGGEVDPSTIAKTVSYLPSESLNQGWPSSTQWDTGIPASVGTVLISFVKPDLETAMWVDDTATLATNGITGDWGSYGLSCGPSITPEYLKTRITNLQNEGREVCLSIGGATYNNWGPIIAEAKAVYDNGLAHATQANTPKIYAISQLAQKLGVDRLEVDFEDTAVPNGSGQFDKFYMTHMATVAIYVASKLAGFSDPRVDMSTFSTGWSQDDRTLENSTTYKLTGDLAGKKSWYGGNAGQSLGATKYTYNGENFGTNTIPSSGFTAGELDYLQMLRMVNLMTYDFSSADEPVYDSLSASSSDYGSVVSFYIDCLRAIQFYDTEYGTSLYDSIQVNIGVSGSEGAGGGVSVISNNDAVSHANVLYADVYNRKLDTLYNSADVNRTTVNGFTGETYSIENYATFINKVRKGTLNGTYPEIVGTRNDSIMSWALFSQSTGQPYDDILNAANTYLNP